METVACFTQGNKIEKIDNTDTKELVFFARFYLIVHKTNTMEVVR